jgi:hypothetical protein
LAAQVTKCGRATPLWRRAFVTTEPSFATLFGTEISDGLLLDSLQLAASSALASELIAYSFTLL